MNMQSAKSLFFEYRALARNEAQVYNDLKTAFPMQSFPKHARRFWKSAVLAELWGSIATQLGSDKIDYLKQWRAEQ
jgi:hypothetical protein